MKIMGFDKRTMMGALENLVEHAYAQGLGGRDATVIATMKMLHIDKILSHDGAFKRLATELAIEAIDPIPTARNKPRQTSWRRAGSAKKHQKPRKLTYSPSMDEPGTRLKTQ